MQEIPHKEALPERRSRSPSRCRRAKETHSAGTRGSIRAGFMFAASLLAACAGQSELKPFPDDWSPLATHSIAECPNLQGRYQVLGSDVGLRDVCMRGAADAGSWNCSRRLDEQFRFDDPLPFIAVTQPDADTLVFAGLNIQGTPVEKRFSRSAGDFRCAGNHVIFTARGSFFSDENTSTGDGALATAGGLLLLRGGVRTLERALSVSTDEALVMNLTVTNTGVLFPIPFHAAFSAWIRWPSLPAPPATVSGRPAP